MQGVKSVLSIDCDYITTPEKSVEIVNFFLKHVENIEIKNINFSQIHANIHYILQPLLLNKESIDIVNIDHHHDIYYKEYKEDAFKSSSWLGHYLKYPNFIQNAYWLCNYDSIKTSPDDLINMTYNINDVDFKRFDYLFVCESPIYCTPFGSVTYNILFDIVKHTKKINNEDFYKPNILNHIAREIVHG